MKLRIGLSCLILCSVSFLRAGDTSTARIQNAATKAVALIQKSQKTRYAKASCFSCHQQLFPAIAFRYAREHGIPVDEKAAHDDAAAAFGFYSNLERAVEYTHIIDPPWTMATHWETIDGRPPQSYSSFTATAIPCTRFSPTGTRTATKPTNSSG
jgi:hypothetical protein